MDRTGAARLAFQIGAVVTAFGLFGLAVGAGVQEAVIIVQTWPILMVPYAYILARRRLADRKGSAESA